MAVNGRSNGAHEEKTTMRTILCRSWFDEVWISRGRWWELKLGSTRTELYSTDDDKYPFQNGTK